MSEWRDDTPWWPDTGTRVEAVLEDGTTIIGDLWADDYAVIEEGPDAGEEIPFFSLRVGSESKSWFDFPIEKWRSVGQATF